VKGIKIYKYNDTARSIIYVSVVSVRVSLIIIYGWGFLEEMYWRCFCNCVKVAYSWGLIDTIGNIILFYYDSIISYSDNSGWVSFVTFSVNLYVSSRVE